jgi:hypothetical protein
VGGGKEAVVDSRAARTDGAENGLSFRNQAQRPLAAPGNNFTCAGRKDMANQSDYAFDNLSTRIGRCARLPNWLFVRRKYTSLCFAVLVQK